MHEKWGREDAGEDQDAPCYITKRALACKDGEHVARDFPPFTRECQHSEQTAEREEHHHQHTRPHHHRGEVGNRISPVAPVVRAAASHVTHLATPLAAQDAVTMLAIAHVNTLVNAGTAASLHTYEYINKLDLCVKRREERERGGRREKESNGGGDGGDGDDGARGD